MDRDRQLQLTDQIHRQQPNLMASGVALHRGMGASLQQIEPLVSVLRVTWHAMKCIGRQWPLVSEQLQADCL